MVPSRENRAVFWEIGRSWPLQKAQCSGAKFPANSRISATKGSLILSCASVLGWEDALEGDTERNRQEGRHVVVGLAAANNIRDDARRHSHSRRCGIGIFATIRP